jgi:hypothetical protein
MISETTVVPKAEFDQHLVEEVIVPDCASSVRPIRQLTNQAPQPTNSR